RVDDGPRRAGALRTRVGCGKRVRERHGGLRPALPGRRREGVRLRPRAERRGAPGVHECEDGEDAYWRRGIALWTEYGVNLVRRFIGQAITPDLGQLFGPEVGRQTDKPLAD